MQVQEIHQRSLQTSTRLSSFQVERMIPPAEVIRILNNARIRFVLVGTYGLAGWVNKPRATQDVDVVVAARQVKRAVKELCTVFPELGPVELPAAVQLCDRETEAVAIEVIKPLEQPYRELFKYTHEVRLGDQTYLVPSLEMAIILKFASMTSLQRAMADKYQDAHDFILLVKQNPDFDREKLAEIASLLYPNGGKDALELARRVQAGEKLNL